MTQTTIKGILTEPAWLWCVSERRGDEDGRPAGPWEPIPYTIADTRAEAIARYEAYYRPIGRAYSRDRRRGFALASYVILAPCHPGRS